MIDYQTLRDVELGNRPVVAVVERILLESAFVHEHTERIGSIVYRLGDRVSRLEGVSGGEAAGQLELRGMVNRIRRRLQHCHTVEARVDSNSWRGQGSIKPRVDAGEYARRLHGLLFLESRGWRKLSGCPRIERP